MVGNEFDPDEHDAADSRIDRIRGRGEQQPARPIADDDLGGFDDEVTARPRAGRAVFSDADDVYVVEDDDAPGPASPMSGAFLLIGGLVVFGLAMVILLMLFRGGSLGSILPFGATATPTMTPTPTFTPTPTLTPTPSATPTPEVPFLPLPPLACAYTAVDCQVYCQDAANVEECADSRAFVEAQDADFDYWLTCMAEGTDPQTCMEEAWRILH